MPSAADSQAVDARVRRTPAKSTPPPKAPKGPKGLGAKVMQMPPAKTGAGAGTQGAGATAKLPMPMLANTSKSKSIAKPPMHPPAKSPGRPGRSAGRAGTSNSKGSKGSKAITPVVAKTRVKTKAPALPKVPSAPDVDEELSPATQEAVRQFYAMDSPSTPTDTPEEEA